MYGCLIFISANMYIVIGVSKPIFGIFFILLYPKNTLFKFLKINLRIKIED